MTPIESTKPGWIVGLWICLLSLVIVVGAEALTRWVPSRASSTPVRATKVAILDFGDSKTGKLAAANLAGSFKTGAEWVVLDRDLSRVAALGSGYSGSLNMSLTEARDLGAAMGCDYYLVGEAQTLRRSPSSGPIYYESYAAIFLVSARTGSLLTWERPSFTAATPDAAESLLLSALSSGEVRNRYVSTIRLAQQDETQRRENPVQTPAPLLAEASNDDKSVEAHGLRPPRPYRRLRPAYPDSAARAEAEATVDVLVDLDARGEVTHVEVARWAGFGLDQATIDTVRQLHFFPALSNGTPVPIRILLRYNFRKPPRERGMKE